MFGISKKRGFVLLASTAAMLAVALGGPNVSRVQGVDFGVGGSNGCVTQHVIPAGTVVGYAQLYVKFHLVVPAYPTTVLGQWTLSNGTTAPQTWWGPGPFNQWVTAAQYNYLGVTLTPGSSGTATFVLQKSGPYGDCFEVSDIVVTKVPVQAGGGGGGVATQPPGGGGVSLPAPTPTPTPPPAVTYPPTGTPPPPPPGWCYTFTFATPSPGATVPMAPCNNDLVPTAPPDTSNCPVTPDSTPTSVGRPYCKEDVSGGGTITDSAEGVNFVLPNPAPEGVIIWKYVHSSSNSDELRLAVSCDGVGSSGLIGGTAGQVHSGSGTNSGKTFVNGEWFFVIVRFEDLLSGNNWQGGVLDYDNCDAGETFTIGTHWASTGVYTIVTEWAQDDDNAGSICPGSSLVCTDDGEYTPPSAPPVPSGGPTPPPGWGSPPPIYIDVEVDVDICEDDPTILACQSGIDICAANPDIAACAEIGSWEGTPNPSGVGGEFGEVWNHLMSKAPFGYAHQAKTALEDAANDPDGGGAPGAGGFSLVFEMPVWMPDEAGGSQSIEIDLGASTIASYMSPYRPFLVILVTIMFGVTLIRWAVRATGTSAGGGDGS